MSAIEAVSQEIWRWQVPGSDPDMPDLVGHAILTSDGWLVFDPPAAPGVVATLHGLGPVCSIVLTGGHHDRAAGALRARVGMPPIAAPGRDLDMLMQGGVLVDRALAEGDQICGFDVIDLPAVGNFAAEFAFFEPQRRILVISDLVVAGPRRLMYYGEAFGVDVPARLLRPYVQRLAELAPEIVLAGHGQDVTSAGARRLAELCARE